jgi:hypothetical protein
MKHFYVYVDFTADDHTPFYVGKGGDNRVKNLKRNNKHRAVSKHHGTYRRIVLDTSDEQQAFSYEKLLISKLHTFVEDSEAPNISCNFMIGGEGASNPSAETRRKISEASKNRPPRSAEYCANISAAQRGKTLSEDHRAKMSEAQKKRWERRRAEKAQSQDLDIDLKKL